MNSLLPPHRKRMNGTETTLASEIQPSPSWNGQVSLASKAGSKRNRPQYLVELKEKEVDFSDEDFLVDLINLLIQIQKPRSLRAPLRATPNILRRLCLQHSNLSEPKIQIVDHFFLTRHCSFAQPLQPFLTQPPSAPQFVTIRDLQPPHFATQTSDKPKACLMPLYTCFSIARNLRPEVPDPTLPARKALFTLQLVERFSRIEAVPAQPDLKSEA